MLYFFSAYTTKTEMFSNEVSKNESNDVISQEEKFSETYFHCEICDKGFTNKKQFQSHKRSHGGREFKCKICQKRFSRSSNLRRHEKINSGGKICGKPKSIKTFECKICTKFFGQSQHLKRHMNNIHSRERKFTCNTCGKCFQTKEHLKSAWKNLARDRLCSKILGSKCSWA